MIEIKKEYDLYLNWLITNNCNYTCAYCFGGKNQKNITPPLDILKILNRIKKIKKTILFDFTGGEPFLIPNFTDLVIELSKNHLISIDTNFSQKQTLNKFLNNVNPNNVMKIVFSTHMQERERRKENIEDLCLLINKFKNKGFRIWGNYVMYPPVINRMEKDINFFKSHGINVYPSLFQGKYNNKLYGVDKNGITGYNDSEIKLINKYIPESDLNIFNTKNSLCLAGSRAFAISQEKVLSCWTISKNMGNFFDDNWENFDKVIRCPKNYCACPFNSDFKVNFHGNDLQTKLLHKTIKEHGIYSKSKSKKITNVSSTKLLLDKNIGLIGILLLKKFPYVYNFLKNKK